MFNSIIFIIINIINIIINKFEKKLLLLKKTIDLILNVKLKIIIIIIITKPTALESDMIFTNLNFNFHYDNNLYYLWIDPEQLTGHFFTAIHSYSLWMSQSN